MKKITIFIAVMAISFTEAQVSLVKDIYSGPNSGFLSNPTEITAINNKVVFSVFAPSSGHEVWISDGTLSGTLLLHDIFPGSSSNPRNFYYWQAANEVVFTANDGATSTKIFSTQETQSSLKFVNAQSDGTNYFQYNNSILLFQGFINNISNNQFDPLYFPSVNITGGVSRLDFSGNSNYSGFNDAVLLNNKIYHQTISTSEGIELFISDFINGPSNTVIIDIVPGTNGSFPKGMTVFNNKVYFTANDGINGRELWVTDGTVAGTQIILDLNSGSTSSNPENLTVFNNALYFSATHPTLGTEIFKMNTNQNITSLKNIANGGGSSSPSDLLVFNNKLYFSADDNINGRELWSSTGFSSTTNMVKDINASPATPDSNPTGFTEYFGELFFSANDDTNGRELWKTDGTAAGTVLVSDINTSGDSNPENLTVAGDNLFFSATTPATGKELFKYRNPSLSVQNLELESSVSLFPNPANSSFLIETNQIIKNITIYDVQGKTVKIFKEGLSSFNIEELTSGLYFVNIKTDKGAVTKKLIKE